MTKLSGYVLFSSLLKRFRLILQGFIFISQILLQFKKQEVPNMERLKLLRKQNHLTQQQLADILHVSQQSIHKYEHNITNPDLDTLRNLANHFHTTVDYILGITDIPNKPDPVTDTMLNHAELDLLENYRNADTSRQDLLQQAIYAFLEANAK